MELGSGIFLIILVSYFFFWLAKKQGEEDKKNTFVKRIGGTNKLKVIGSTWIFNEFTKTLHRSVLVKLVDGKVSDYLPIAIEQSYFYLHYISLKEREENAN